jgi:hypothetical protein
LADGLKERKHIVNLHKTFAIGLALLGIAGLTSAAASAQTVTKGTFTLPAQAYWNSTLLQPGQYTMSVDRTLTGIDLVHLRGEGINATFMTPAGAEDGTVKNCLKVDDLNGTYVIRELDAGAIGRSYYFGVSKSVRNRTLSGAVSQPVTIPVSSAAGL